MMMRSAQDRYNEEIQIAVEGVMALRPSGTHKERRFNPAFVRRRREVQYQRELEAIDRGEQTEPSTFFYHESRRK